MTKKKLAEDPRKELFNRVASTADGLAVLRAILDITNYDKPIMRFDPSTSELSTQATIYNLSKRDVWLAIRQHISPEHLAKIENRRD